MKTDSTRVVFHLDGDLRLIAPIRSAVHFEAARAGLNAGGCDELAKAFEDVCRETLLQLRDADRGLEITIDTFMDRIEVSIRHPGQPIPAVGLKTASPTMASAGESGRLDGMELLELVDRVMFNSEDAAGRTTLVKFLQPKRGTSKRKRK
jgi:hypothetical protein